MTFGRPLGWESYLGRDRCNDIWAVAATGKSSGTTGKVVWDDREVVKDNTVVMTRGRSLGPESRPGRFGRSLGPERRLGRDRCKEASALAGAGTSSGSRSL